MSIKIEFKIHARNLLGRGDGEVILHANTIEEMEKLVELSKKIKMDVSLL